MSDDLYSGLASKYYRNAALKYGASAFSEIIGGSLNYRMLTGNAGNYSVEANNVELQALQRANQLRQQFSSAVGSYLFNAANRGISTSSGSVRSNIENSAMNLGYDLAIQQKNAQMRADALRTQAKIAKKEAKYNLIGNAISAIGSLGEAAYSGANAYGYKKYGKEWAELDIFSNLFGDKK